MDHLEPRDAERWPNWLRLLIDMEQEGHGARLSVVSKRACREALKGAPLKSYRIEAVGTPCDNRTDRVRRANDKPNFRTLDEWDMVQAFAPVHQPPTRYLDMPAMNQMFKEIYSSDRIGSLALDSSPSMDMIPPNPIHGPTRPL